MGGHRVGSLSLGLLAFALAAPAAAEGPIPETIWGSVEAGAYLSTEDSYEWGDYTGIKDDAWYGLANLELHGRAPWFSEDTWHFDFQGSNLALDSRFLSLSRSRFPRVYARAESEMKTTVRCTTEVNPSGGLPPSCSLIFTRPIVTTSPSLIGWRLPVSGLPFSSEPLVEPRSRT